MKDKKNITDFDETSFVHDIKTIISKARNITGRAANLMQVASCWLMGWRIVEQEQMGMSKAMYGKHVIELASKVLTSEFGKGYSETSLRDYRKFYLTFKNLPIIECLPKDFQNELFTIQRALLAESHSTEENQQPLLAELSWMHYMQLMRIKDEKAREWYMYETASQQWDYRTLKRNIDSQYYYRLLQTPEYNRDEVMSEMKEKTAEYQKTRLTYLKNPIIAEFLGFSQDMTFSERNLESAIITHLQKFIMELGKGYAFVARQQHIRTDAGDFYIDLVFYNVYMKCYLLIDLKTTQITHQDIGQMDMYIHMYDELKCTDGDNPTIGLILCSETSEDLSRFSALRYNQQLFAAKYLTYLPDKELLRKEIEEQKQIFLLQKKKY